MSKHKRGRISRASAAKGKVKISRSFAQQVAEFIGRYRPALEGLAKR